MTDLKISRGTPAWDLLSKLRARDGAGYLVDAGRGRYALIINEGVGRTIWRRWRAYNLATVRALNTAGLIDWTNEYADLGDYLNRQRLDGQRGDKVILTDAGRTALQKARI